MREPIPHAETDWPTPPPSSFETAPGEPHATAEALLAGQNRALELIARGRPLVEILEFLTGLIESQAPGLRCSVLLLEDGKLWQGAAPSLPAPYREACEGLAIGPAVGSCGTAAFTGRGVVSTDIAADPRWAAGRDVALRYGLRACWSTPILSRAAEVLGTFAIYYGEPIPPRAADVHLVEVATHLAGIAIERDRADRALKDRADALARADRRKDEFLALLGHEMRTPLASMVMALELMRARADDAAAVARHREVIERQLRQLIRLADDLLDVSRIARGKIELARERVTVAGLVARAVETARPLIEQRRHRLEISSPAGGREIEVDPVRIVQALYNLLQNAAKYTPDGGRIELVAEEGPREVVLRVRDSGVGISPDMLPRIFDLFFQASPAHDRSQGGLGLGLTLVRQLVELHGGRVEAWSAGLGQGSEFVVHLPAP